MRHRGGGAFFSIAIMLVGCLIDCLDMRMQFQKVDINHPYLEYFQYYPKELNPPQFLYVQGKLPDSAKRPKTAAIVGARRCTKYGENIAYNLAFQLAKRGVVIVSGLAFGIDSCAHRGCLDAGGTTIAVLGTPIDQIYPRSNLGLAQRILEKGAIVSEYEPGAPIYRENFLYRNRIVSGMSDIVVVVESSLHSGTHYTAARAEEQGKTIYAVPGDISRPMSEGCHYLIQTCNCNVCTGVDDLLVGLHLRPDSGKKAEKFAVDYSGCTPIQLGIIACLRTKITEPAEMAKYLDCDISVITSNITLMQIRGLIKREKGIWTLA